MESGHRDSDQRRRREETTFSTNDHLLNPDHHWASGSASPNDDEGGRGYFPPRTNQQDSDTALGSWRSRPSNGMYGNDMRRTSICPWCTRKHRLVECPVFALRPVEERRQFVTDKRLCYCCLEPHPVRTCRRRARCPVKDCNGFHHKLIHMDRPPPSARIR